MKKIMKKFMRKLIYNHRADSESYINWLIKQGVKVGGGTHIYDPQSTLIDAQRPYLMTIGENVQITHGVTILTHGYDWSVLKGVYGDVIGSAGEVVIGNNVFIGMNGTILKNVHIGNNVIIGANSLVNKSFPDNVVIAGNPAKVICTLEEYYKKRLSIYEQEAICLVKCYRKKYNKEPGYNELHEFFWLFTDSNDELIPLYKHMNELVTIDKTNEKFKQNKKKYKDINDFLKSVPWGE